jgi:hypothetical protein
MEFEEFKVLSVTSEDNMIFQNLTAIIDLSGVNAINKSEYMTHEISMQIRMA